jgi:hypothetical protein
MSKSQAKKIKIWNGHSNLLSKVRKMAGKMNRRSKNSLGLVKYLLVDGAATPKNVEPG